MSLPAAFNHRPAMRGRAVAWFCVLAVRGVFVVAIRKQGPLQVDEQSSADPEVAQSSKAITFIRHGMSVGNAKLEGVWKHGFTGYRDGVLMLDGEEQAIQRVALMSEALLQRIRDAEVVLVSPLSRAMGTAIIILAQAHKGAKPAEWPMVEVVTELREKVKSDSERPGTGDKTALHYVEHLASKYGEEAFKDKNAMDSLVENMRTSYESERRRTNDWTPEPLNAVAFADMVQESKRKLALRPESRVLMVGHSGWARFAFASFMPPAEGDQGSLSNLIDGARKIRPLNNCGVVQADFAGGIFRNVVIDPLVPGDTTLPNCEKKHKVGVLVSLEEAKAEGVVPDDATMARFFMGKKKAWKALNGFTDRVITVTTTGSGDHYQAHLAWADEWGEPISNIALEPSSIVLEHSSTALEFTLVLPGMFDDRMFEAKTREDFRRFSEVFGRIRGAS